MQAKKEKIDELSTMAGGNVTSGAVTGDELEENTNETQSSKKLRIMVREAIKLYAQKKNKLSKNVVFEEKIRQFIRSKLLAEKQSKETPPGTTLEGIMRTLLNNIIPQLRIQYMQLQSNDEERQGFKDYFYNAVDQISDLTKDQRDAEEQEVEVELEEEKITVKKSEDPDFISGVDDGDEQSEEESTPEEKDSRKDISSFFERGQNFGEKAFMAIKDRIQDVVASQIVPEEYPEFERVLNANLQAWFKIWDQNRTKSDTSQLEIPDEPVEPLETGGENELLDQEPVDQEAQPTEEPAEIPAEEPAEEPAA